MWVLASAVCPENKEAWGEYHFSDRGSLRFSFLWSRAWELPVLCAWGIAARTCVFQTARLACKLYCWAMEGLAL